MNSSSEDFDFRILLFIFAGLILLLPLGSLFIEAKTLHQQVLRQSEVIIFTDHGLDLMCVLIAIGLVILGLALPGMGEKSVKLYTVTGSTLIAIPFLLYLGYHKQAELSLFYMLVGAEGRQYRICKVLPNNAFRSLHRYALTKEQSSCDQYR